jgi:hypothetical protein
VALVVTEVTGLVAALRQSSINMRCAKIQRYRLHSSVKIQAFALQLQRRRTELKTLRR